MRARRRLFGANTPWKRLLGTDVDDDGIDDALDVDVVGGTDADGNGIADAREPSDTDGGGTPDHADIDADGTPDRLDSDSDNDGVSCLATRATPGARTRWRTCC